MSSTRLLISPGYTPLTLLRGRTAEFLDPADLDIDDRLRCEFATWADEHESVRDDPTDPARWTFPADYLARGRALSRRIALQLGPTVSVYWASEPALDARSLR